ncbi:DNA replication complex GINS family protein [Candidatus Bathyarchaeota archaeon]|nr:MAG: DNA replication complex GINS family protein [Candidatus Bathyarchaeota archaeon]
MPTIYDEAFEAWRRELRWKELQSLDPDFFKRIAAHMRQLREAQRNLDAKSLKSGVLEEEARRLQPLLRHLVSTRLEKIIRASRSNHPVSVSVAEKWILDQVNSVSRYVERLENDLVQGVGPQTSPEPDEGGVLVRFVKDVPAIMGVDLRTHGPFLKEDVADLPSENAASLIREGLAVEIRIPIRENG